MFDLSNETFLIYAAKAYDRPHYLTSEFQEDIVRIKYVKRLLKKYRQTKDIKERLVLNHIIILSNVFGPEATVNMLFFRVDKEDYPALKTLLLFLNYLPETFTVTFNKKLFNHAEVTVDLELAKRLREI